MRVAPYPGPYKIYTNYVFTSSQEATLKLYDLEAKSKIGEEKILVGENKTFQSLRSHLFFQSDKPVMLAIYANDGGLMVACLKAGQDVYLRVPSDESFILPRWSLEVSLRPDFLGILTVCIFVSLSKGMCSIPPFL